MQVRRKFCCTLEIHLLESGVDHCCGSETFVLDLALESLIDGLKQLFFQIESNRISDFDGLDSLQIREIAPVST